MEKIKKIHLLFIIFAIIAICGCASQNVDFHARGEMAVGVGVGGHL